VVVAEHLADVPVKRRLYRGEQSVERTEVSDLCTR